jgi:hypothetical protein
MGINHEDAPIGEIHKFINWEFATATELDEYSNIVAKDFHKVAYVAEVQGYFAPIAVDAGTGEVTWISVGGSGSGGTTNLSTAYTATNVTVLSSTGTDAVIAAANEAVAGVMLPAQVTKLAGIAVGATVNATDAALRDRATHTGTQSSTTISDLTETVQDLMGTYIVAGTNVTVTYNDTTGTVTIAATGGGTTNLSYTASPTNGVVVSDTGTDATLLLSTGTNAGLMAPSQFTKLAGLNIGTAGADVPNNTQLDVRLGTTGNLGTAAQRTIGTGTSDVPDVAQLNSRIGTAGNLGTMAQQNANAVAIAGGAINATTIGNTNPSTGNFTTLNTTDGLSVTAPSSAAGWASIKTISYAGAGVGVGFEAVGARGDGNSSFYGRLGLAHRRADGTPISAGGIGAVCFGAQWGTDTAFTPAKVLYSASITAVCESSFSSASNMPTAIVFSTGATGQDLRSANVNYGTEVMRLSSAGNLGVGVTNPALHKVEVSGRAYASGGFVFPAFTVATVPSASANTNAGIIVTNAASGRRPYWSNGTDWRDAANVLLA